MKRSIEGIIMNNSEDFDDMPPLEDAPTVPHYVQAQTQQATNQVTNSLENDSESDESEDEEDWEETDEVDVGLSARCLFCSSELGNPCLVFAHMASEHNFDMFAAASEWDLDQVSYIKFVNYVRKIKPTAEVLMSSNSQLWQARDFMQATIPGDTMLTFDAEDFYEECSEEDASPDKETLQNTCEELRAVIGRQGDALKRLLEMNNGGRSMKVVKTVSDIDAEEDEGYFNSYAYFDIHHEMLSDRVRTLAYQSAIKGNESLFNGKNVLDLGCGTAILSMFAAQVGGRVTAVDMSDVIYHAIEIVKENNLEDVITLKKGRLEDMNFTAKFDVIVSEWMGYFLLFEGMLDSVVYARNHYLAPGGVLMPNRCTLHLVGAEDMKSYEKYVNFWSDVYGLNMSCMAREAIKEASTEVVNSECICTTAAQIADFDLMKVSPQDTEFSSDFEMICQRDGKLTCFVGYFDTFFDLPNSVYFSTGPTVAPTHWKQTIFYLPKLRYFKKDEVLRGKIIVKRKKKELRSLNVVILFDNKKFNYFVE